MLFEQMLDDCEPLDRTDSHDQTPAAGDCPTAADWVLNSIGRREWSPSELQHMRHCAFCQVSLDRWDAHPSLSMLVRSQVGWGISSSEARQIAFHVEARQCPACLPVLQSDWFKSTVAVLRTAQRIPENLTQFFRLVDSFGVVPNLESVPMPMVGFSAASKGAAGEQRCGILAADNLDVRVQADQGRILLKVSHGSLSAGTMVRVSIASVNGETRQLFVMLRSRYRSGACGALGEIDLEAIPPHAAIAVKVVSLSEITDADRPALISSLRRMLIDDPAARCFWEQWLCELQDAGLTKLAADLRPALPPAVKTRSSVVFASAKAS
jgi:hypothetical protein